MAYQMVLASDVGWVRAYMMGIQVIRLGVGRWDCPNIYQGVQLS